VPKLGLLDTLLTSGPVGSLLGMAGINMTQKVLEAQEKQANIWDRRIPLITDDNFEDLIANVDPSSKDEVWFIIISTTAAKKDALSTLFDERFDEAYDLTIKANDLQHVKWGRIDYFNVTRITTKWNVWRGPIIVILADRGRTLRFLHTRQLRPQPDLMRDWLDKAGYLNIPVWESIYGPGGEREYILDNLAIVCDKWYRTMSSIPGWLLYIGTGAGATLLVQMLHRGSTAKFEREKAARRQKQALESTKTPSTGGGTNKPVSRRSGAKR